MNRRNFFKTVTGFVAGVFVACVPKAKAKEWKHVVAPYNGSANTDDIEIVYGDKPSYNKPEDGTSNVGVVRPSSTVDESGKDLIENKDFSGWNSDLIAKEI